MTIQESHQLRFPSPRRSGIVKRGSPLKRTVIDTVSLFLIYFVVLTTFFPLETYLAGGESGDVALPLPVNSITLLFTSVFIIVLGIEIERSGTRIRHPYLLYLYVALAFASTLWADDLRLAILRSLRLAMFAGLGVVFSHYYDFRKVMKMLVWAVLLSAISSILISVLVPSLGISRIGGAYESVWRGAQSHKNFAGVIYGLGIIIAFYSWRMKTASLTLNTITFLACLFMLAMANSATSAAGAIASIFSCIAISWIRYFPRATRGLVGLAAISSIIAAGLLLVLNLESIFSAFGRDLTFTGRTEIWEAVWDKIMEKPFLGFGYGFWSGDGRELARLRIILDFGAAAHSHNTWLDVWLQLGVFAMILIAAVHTKAIYMSAKLYLLEQKTAYLLSLALLLFFLYRSFTEISFTDPYIIGIFWLAWCSGWVNRRYAERAESRAIGPKRGAD